MTIFIFFTAKENYTKNWYLIMKRCGVDLVNLKNRRPKKFGLKKKCIAIRLVDLFFS